MTHNPKSNVHLLSPSQDGSEGPKSRLRAGRKPQRTEKSRLKKAPPPNSIRFFRRRAGLSLAELSQKLGYSRETVRRLEERDVWLSAERASAIGRVLRIPKEVLGFSSAPNAYQWAAKSFWVKGYVNAQDELKDDDTLRRHLAGSSNLPEDIFAYEILQGKLRGRFLVYRPESSENMSKDVLDRQGLGETFIACLHDGSLWWRHITPAARSGLYHLTSRYQDPILDVKIAWVAKIVAIEPASMELPTREQIENLA